MSLDFSAATRVAVRELRTGERLGRLYLDLPEAALARLDRFEGGDYERHEVLVTLSDGSWQRAWTYLFKPGLAARLDDGDWDEARFERDGKVRFVARYVGFDAL